MADVQKKEEPNSTETKAQVDLDEKKVNFKPNVKNDSALGKNPDSLEFALRRFKRESSGIVSEVRKREAYEKPSVRRKKKSEAARRNKNKKFGNKW